MKFLGLHGAIGSKQNFAVQLGPLEQEFENENISFVYFDAPQPVKPPEGFATYFGLPPHYRWIKDDDLAYQGMLERVRRLPVGETPEEVMRRLGDRKDVEISDTPAQSWATVLESLHQILETNPDIRGIVGYSEGACIAATLIVDEILKFQETGRERRIECAVFFMGWPPVHTKERKVILSDESDLTIDVPTLHVIGANDPYKSGGVALYNVCNRQTAEIFDTGKGHTLPRTGRTNTELADAIRNLIQRAADHGHSENCVDSEVAGHDERGST